MVDNNNAKWLKNIKRCPNRCRTWVTWNELLAHFIEAKTCQIHICPKRKHNPNQQRKSCNKKINTLKRDEVTYLDTIGSAIAEILSITQEILRLLHKIDDSTAKFQGGII